jgi:hypothetical protein
LKLYLHKKFLGPIVFFGVCVIIGIIKTKSEGLNFVNLFLLISSFSFVFAGTYLMWHYRKGKESLPKSQRPLKVEFKSNSINFPEGYYFKHSTLTSNNLIEASIINEVNLLTYPVSVVINGNEVIFLGYDHKDELKKFAQKNKLKMSERFDIWEHLNEPFLDTEFTEQEENQTNQRLIKNGLLETEILTIRKKIKWIMWRYTWGMEWVYLGQFDYLRLTYLTKKKYWWSMNIALKNYKNGVQQPSS